MSRVPHLYKVAAVFTALCMELTSIAMPDARAEAVPPFPTSVQKLDIRKLALPEKFGEVVESHAGKGNVIIVQDAHAIPDAQKNIANVIKFIQKEYGVEKVALEGASGDLDAQIFRSFPNQKLLREVMKGYMDAGEIAGGTAAAVFDETATQYIGVEDWDVYEEGLGLYLAAMGKEAELSERLGREREKLDAEKAKVYSKALWAVDQEVEKFYNDAAQLAELIQILGKVQPPQAGSELEALWKEISKSAARGSVLGARDIEVRELAAKIEKVLKSSGAVKAFNSRKQEWMTGEISAEAFAMYLRETAQELGLDLEMSTELGALVRDQQTLKGLEGTKLFRDLETYIKEVKAQLINEQPTVIASETKQSPAAAAMLNQIRSLDQRTEFLRLLTKLAKMELPRAEWKQMSEGLVFEALNSFGLAQDEFVFHLAFYLNAEERDQIFFENLLNDERRVTSNESRDNRPAIIVAGGFHAEGLTSRLKEAGMGYALVMPKINHIPENNSYKAQMRGEVSWKDYFEVENGRIHLYKAFVRATRDRLIAKGTDPNAGLGTGSVPDVRLLKSWRDQIIRDLSDQGKIERAAFYTRYMDEVADQTIDQRLKTTDQLMMKVDNFIRGLRGLEKANQLTSDQIASLLKANMIQAKHATAILSTTGSTAADMRVELRRAEIIAGKIERRNDVSSFDPIAIIENETFNGEGLSFQNKGLSLQGANGLGKSTIAVLLLLRGGYELISNQTHHIFRNKGGEIFLGQTPVVEGELSGEVARYRNLDSRLVRSDGTVIQDFYSEVPIKNQPAQEKASVPLKFVVSFGENEEKPLGEISIGSEGMAATGVKHLIIPQRFLPEYDFDRDGNLDYKNSLKEYYEKIAEVVDRFIRSNGTIADFSVLESSMTADLFPKVKAQQGDEAVDRSEMRGNNLGDDPYAPPESSSLEKRLEKLSEVLSDENLEVVVTRVIGPISMLARAAALFSTALLPVGIFMLFANRILGSAQLPYVLFLPLTILFRPVMAWYENTLSLMKDGVALHASSVAAAGETKTVYVSVNGRFLDSNTGIPKDLAAMKAHLGPFAPSAATGQSRSEVRLPPFVLAIVAAPLLSVAANAAITSPRSKAEPSAVSRSQVVAAGDLSELKIPIAVVDQIQRLVAPLANGYQAEGVDGLDFTEIDREVRKLAELMQVLSPIDFWKRAGDMDMEDLDLIVYRLLEAVQNGTIPKDEGFLETIHGLSRFANPGEQLWAAVLLTEAQKANGKKVDSLVLAEALRRYHRDAQIDLPRELVRKLKAATKLLEKEILLTGIRQDDRENGLMHDFYVELLIRAHRLLGVDHADRQDMEYLINEILTIVIDHLTREGSDRGITGQSVSYAKMAVLILIEFQKKDGESLEELFDRAQEKLKQIKDEGIIIDDGLWPYLKTLIEEEVGSARSEARESYKDYETLFSVNESLRIPISMEEGDMLTLRIPSASPNLPGEDIFGWIKIERGKLYYSRGRQFLSDAYEPGEEAPDFEWREMGNREQILFAGALVSIQSQDQGFKIDNQSETDIYYFRGEPSLKIIASYLIDLLAANKIESPVTEMLRRGIEQNDFNPDLVQAIKRGLASALVDNFSSNDRDRGAALVFINLMFIDWFDPAAGTDLRRSEMRRRDFLAAVAATLGIGSISGQTAAWQAPYQLPQPEDFQRMSSEEKLVVMREAVTKVIDQLLSLDSIPDREILENYRRAVLDARPLDDALPDGVLLHKVTKPKTLTATPDAKPAPVTVRLSGLTMTALALKEFLKFRDTNGKEGLNPAAAFSLIRNRDVAGGPARPFLEQIFQTYRPGVMVPVDENIYSKMAEQHEAGVQSFLERWNGKGEGVEYSSDGDVQIQISTNALYHIFLGAQIMGSSDYFYRYIAPLIMREAHGWHVFTQFPSVTRTVSDELARAAGRAKKLDQLTFEDLMIFANELAADLDELTQFYLANEVRETLREVNARQFFTERGFIREDRLKDSLVVGRETMSEETWGWVEGLSAVALQQRADLTLQGRIAGEIQHRLGPAMEQFFVEMAQRSEMREGSGSETPQVTRRNIFELVFGTLAIVVPSALFLSTREILQGPHALEREFAYELARNYRVRRSYGSDFGNYTEVVMAMYKILLGKIQGRAMNNRQPDEERKVGRIYPNMDADPEIVKELAPLLDEVYGTGSVMKERFAAVKDATLFWQFVWAAVSANQMWRTIQSGKLGDAQGSAAALQHPLSFVESDPRVFVERLVGKPEIERVYRNEGEAVPLDVIDVRLTEDEMHQFIFETQLLSAVYKLLHLLQNGQLNTNNVDRLRSGSWDYRDPYTNEWKEHQVLIESDNPAWQQFIDSIKNRVDSNEINPDRPDEAGKLIIDAYLKFKQELEVARSEIRVTPEQIALVGKILETRILKRETDDEKIYVFSEQEIDALFSEEGWGENQIKVDPSLYEGKRVLSLAIGNLPFVLAEKAASVTGLDLDPATIAIQTLKQKWRYQEDVNRWFENQPERTIENALQFIQLLYDLETKSREENPERPYRAEYSQGNINFADMNLLQPMEKPAELYDLVVMPNIFGHSNGFVDSYDFDRFLNSIAGIMSENGKIIIVPVVTQGLGNLREESSEPWYSLRSWVNGLRRDGYSITESGSFDLPSSFGAINSLIMGEKIRGQFVIIEKARSEARILSEDSKVKLKSFMINYLNSWSDPYAPVFEIPVLTDAEGNSIPSSEWDMFLKYPRGVNPGAHLGNTLKELNENILIPNGLALYAQWQGTAGLLTSFGSIVKEVSHTVGEGALNVVHFKDETDHPLRGWVNVAETRGVKMGNLLFVIHDDEVIANKKNVIDDARDYRADLRPYDESMFDYFAEFIGRILAGEAYEGISYDQVDGIMHEDIEIHEVRHALNARLFQRLKSEGYFYSTEKSRNIINTNVQGLFVGKNVTGSSDFAFREAVAEEIAAFLAQLGLSQIGFDTLGALIERVKIISETLRDDGRFSKLSEHDYAALDLMIQLDGYLSNKGIIKSSFLENNLRRALLEGGDVTTKRAFGAAVGRFAFEVGSAVLEKKITKENLTQFAEVTFQKKFSGATLAEGNYKNQKIEVPIEDFLVELLANTSEVKNSDGSILRKAFMSYVGFLLGRRDLPAAEAIRALLVEKQWAFRLGDTQKFVSPEKLAQGDIIRYQGSDYVVLFNDREGEQRNVTVYPIDFRDVRIATIGHLNGRYDSKKLLLRDDVLVFDYDGSYSDRPEERDSDVDLRSEARSPEVIAEDVSAFIATAADLVVVAVSSGNKEGVEVKNAAGEIARFLSRYDNSAQRQQAIGVLHQAIAERIAFQGGTLDEGGGEILNQVFAQSFLLEVKNRLVAALLPNRTNEKNRHLRLGFSLGDKFSGNYDEGTVERVLGRMVLLANGMGITNWAYSGGAAQRAVQKAVKAANKELGDVIHAGVQLDAEARTGTIAAAGEFSGNVSENIFQVLANFDGKEIKDPIQREAVLEIQLIIAMVVAQKLDGVKGDINKAELLDGVHTALAVMGINDKVIQLKNGAFSIDAGALLKAFQEMQAQQAAAVSA